MPDYRYRAVNNDGRTVRGIRTARDEQELYETLKADGLYLVYAGEKRPKTIFHPLPAGRLADFCRKLGLLLGAGIPLARAYDILLQEDGLSRKERMIHNHVLKLVSQGIALSDAMEMQRNVFPPFMIFMIRSAEMSGHLDQAAGYLADQYTREHRLNEKIKSSMAYPKFLCILILIVISVLVGYVLPQFESLFSMVDPLPLSTQILYGSTEALRSHWNVMAAVTVAFLLAGRKFLHIKSIRLVFDRFKINVPVIGKLLKVIYTARFARALSLLYRSGVPIVSAMKIARGTIGNVWIDKQFDAVIANVCSGKNLSDAIMMTEGFVKKLAFSIRVGEETGNLDDMLDSVAEALEYEAEEAMVRLTTYLEPMMIIGMAVIVGFVVISVMMPIYESYSSIEMLAY